MERGRGKLVVEKVGGKSTATRCFSMYPLKFIVPNKVGSDAVWIYTITYGGGIVSGDSIGFDVTVGDGCNAVLTTQSSTKVYKSVGSKCCEQVLEASIGRDAVLAVIPDPVTCFSTARYSQTQKFKLVPHSSLLLVDWITSGRHQTHTPEKWAFSHYKTTNRILLIQQPNFHNHNEEEEEETLFLETVLLEQGASHGTISDRMKDYQAIAMIVLWGPKLKTVQNQIQVDVKKLMSQQLRLPVPASNSKPETSSNNKPSFVASCSKFGPKGMEVGVVVRVASTTTEAIYSFLQHELASMEELLGAPPYR